MSSETEILDRWLERATDRLNPLLIRETRQWLKSPFLMVSFSMLLGLCWFAGVFELAMPRVFTALFFDGPPPGVPTPDGRSLFSLYFVALAAAVFLTVPVTAFFGFSREYAEDAIETLRVTPLSSARVAWGKLQTALMQMFLYMSAVGPFLSLTYLLQGVGLGAIVISLILIAVGGTVLAVAGLALGSFARSLGWQVANLLLLLVAVAIVSWIFLGVGLYASRRGELTILVVSCLCLTLLGAFAIAFGMGVTIQNVRPNAGTPRVAFISIDRLRRIADAARDFAGILRREFPLAGTSRVWTTASSNDFPAVHQEAMRLALVLERMLFDARPSYGDRRLYMTYPFARELLSSLLYTFDLILFELWWKELSTGNLQPRSCRMHADGTPAVSEITPSLLETLESTAEAIDRLCRENADVDTPGAIVDEKVSEDELARSARYCEAVEQDSLGSRSAPQESVAPDRQNAESVR